MKATATQKTPKAFQPYDLHISVDSVEESNILYEIFTHIHMHSTDLEKRLRIPFKNTQNVMVGILSAIKEGRNG